MPPAVYRNIFKRSLNVIIFQYVFKGEKYISNLVNLVDNIKKYAINQVES